MTQSSNRVVKLGLRLWLTATEGIERQRESVTDWVDQSGNALIARQSDLNRCPQYLECAFGGMPALRFDGKDDYLGFSPLELNGLEQTTLVLVSANWSYTENERWGNEGGPHGTVNAALLFDELGEGDVWGCVYLSPFQNSVAMRFGTGQKDNMDFWRRPNTLDEHPSITVGVKRGSIEDLYVNGGCTARYEGRFPAISHTGTVGWLGRGRVDTYGPFDIAEVLIYDRALSKHELETTFDYLGQKYSIELLSRGG